VIFSKHCQDRQQTQDIENSIIKLVIEKPDIELPAKRNDRRKFVRKIDGDQIAVVVKEIKDTKEAIVNTSYKS
jgi:hypothetical protein